MISQFLKREVKPLAIFIFFFVICACQWGSKGNGFRSQKKFNSKKNILVKKKVLICNIAGIDGDPALFDRIIQGFASHKKVKARIEFTRKAPTYRFTGKESVQNYADVVTKQLPRDLDQYDKVVLMGHSTGGVVTWLIAKILAQKGLKDKLVIVNISTPNRGLHLINNRPTFRFLHSLLKVAKENFLLRNIWNRTFQGVSIDMAYNSFNRITDKTSGFGRYLGEHAGIGINELAYGSEFMKSFQLIKEELRVPSLTVAGNNSEVGLKEVLKVPEKLHGLAHLLIAKPIEEQEKLPAINNTIHLFKLLKKSHVIKCVKESFKQGTWKKNEHDFVVSVESQLAGPRNAQKITVPGFHVALDSGLVENTTYGHPLTVETVTNFLVSRLL